MICNQISFVARRFIVLGTEMFQKNRSLKPSKMRLGIVGSREFLDYSLLAATVDSFVENSDIILAFVTASSKGTWDTIRKAQALKKVVRIYNV